MAYRFIQMILAVAVIGLYAQDLNRAAKEGKYSDGKWVLATVVGSLSAVTALAYAVVLFLTSNLAVAVFFAWDLILFILWAAVFGIFGKLYIGTKVEMEPGIQRMKNAVWVDLTNLILWFITAIWGLWMFFSARRRGSLSMHKGER